MSLFVNNRLIVSKQYQKALRLSKYRIVSILFRFCRLLELDRGGRLAGAIVEHAIDMLDLIHDAAGDSAQDIPGHVIAFGSHEVGGGDSTQSHSVVIRALVTHNTDAAHVGQSCVILVDFLVQTGLRDLLAPDSVCVLHDGDLSGVTSPMMRMPRPGPGNG